MFSRERPSKLLLLKVLAVLSPAQAKPNVVMLMTDDTIDLGAK
jgi:hypothetical protein